MLKGGPGDDLIGASGDNASDVVDGGPGNDECIVDRGGKVKNCEAVEVRG